MCGTEFFLVYVFTVAKLISIQNIDFFAAWCKIGDPDTSWYDVSGVPTPRVNDTSGYQNLVGRHLGVPTLGGTIFVTNLSDFKDYLTKCI